MSCRWHNREHAVLPQLWCRSRTPKVMASSDMPLLAPCRFVADPCLCHHMVEWFMCPVRAAQNRAGAGGDPFRPTVDTLWRTGPARAERPRIGSLLSGGSNGRGPYRGPKAQEGCGWSTSRAMAVKKALAAPFLGLSWWTEMAPVAAMMVIIVITIMMVIVNPDPGVIHTDIGAMHSHRAAAAGR